MDDCINIEKAMNMHLLLSQVIQSGINGDAVELGCFKGTSSLIIGETLNLSGFAGEFHVYDSFDGLPDKIDFDGNNFYLKKGHLNTKKEILIERFRERGLDPPVIHEGWFKDTLPYELPERICFANLDGDFYTSIHESLTYIYPRLVKGAIVLVDDYCDPEILDVHNILPGVKRACDDFLIDKSEKINVLLCAGQCHGYFIKH